MPRGAKYGGRTKGTPNKLTGAFREAVLIAYNGIGGHKAFTSWAGQNQTEFYKIAARLIPQEVVGDPDQPLVTKVIFGGRYRKDEDQ